jgi:hypothetical protein
MRNNLSLTQFLLMTVLASSEERLTAAMSLKLPRKRAENLG